MQPNEQSDRFTYEVLRDNLYHLCRDMATELRKICISTVIREAQELGVPVEML